jgi:phage tail sheath protein FI
MANYNKPGVYVEETLTPNIPVAQTVADSVAAFIGVADRGPTALDSNNNVIAVPTLIRNFSDFIDKFSYGSGINTFSGVGVGTSANNLKYAVKTFFDNGGSEAYIVREVNTDAVKSSVQFRDSDSVITQAATFNLDGTTDFSAKKLTITAASGSPFVDMVPGKLVSFAGITETAYLFLNSDSWVISSVATDGSSFSIVWNEENPIGAADQTGTGITIRGGAPSAEATLVVSAKDHGTWGNNIWAGVYPSQANGYFDLYVYYSTTATSASDLNTSNLVERFTNLSMNSQDVRYVGSVVNYVWVTVGDAGSDATGLYDLPSFTGSWSTSVTSANIIDTTGQFRWNTASFATSAVKLGTASPTTNTLSGVLGTNGSDAPNIETDILARLDSVAVPLILNYPAKTITTTINAMLAYASTRGDVFVVIDPADSTIANVLGTGADVGIGSYANNLNYGAVYYPYIVIADPAYTTGATKRIAPGGAVAAVYTTTDTSRGVFKAPAGSAAVIRPAVSVAALTNDEFNLVSGNPTNLNIIRFVPGSGICVMGARTLGSLYSDRYVPVRRTLNYLSSNLKNITEFAVFEPNDQNLWSTVQGVVSGFLDDFWRSGGLAGAIAADAFYVKCDSSINTPAVVSSGELRIEVGVALQRPAEFVIIKIGQIDGGATVTTSV